MPPHEMRKLDFNAALFDMDGTLVDSTALVELEWNEWAKSKGLDPASVARSSHGRRTEDVIREHFPLANIEEEVSNFIRIASGLDQSIAGPIPGAVEFVSSLGAHAWAVVTSAPGAIARQRLAQCGFPEPTVLIGADEVRKGKPDPEGYLTAAHRLLADPSECLVFEDAPSGIEAAKRACMRVVALETTHLRHQLKADVIVRDFRDLRASGSPNAAFCLVVVTS